MNKTKGDHSEDHFIDILFGGKGPVFWIFPVGVFFIAYHLFNVMKGLLENGLDIISLLLFVLLGLLLGGVIVACYQGFVAAQKIIIYDNKAEVYMFSGKKMQFQLEEVVSVEETTVPVLLKNLSSPLGRGGKNYKIQLADNKSFYISSAIANIDHLLGMFTKFSINGVRVEWH